MLKTLSSAAALLAASSLCAQNLPEINGDPANDAFGGAEAGAVGAQHYGTVSTTSDRDYWAITISTAPVQLNAWTSARGASPVNDTNLTLYATDGTT
ncbi:MAG: hypothetical protein KDB80_07650, partial [Planctomycetes bacterium]|nr:hypothetical protein [Planctomycetota bacterium]